MMWCLIKTSRAPVSGVSPHVGESDLRRVVEKFIEKNRLPHLLFYGPPGTGKTSTILAVARRIYGKDYRKQILEVSSPLTLLQIEKVQLLHVAQRIR